MLDPQQLSILLSQHPAGILEFGSIVFAFKGDEGSSLLYKRQTPAGQLIQRGNSPGNAQIESAIVFRFPVYLLCSRMKSSDIRKPQSLSEFINNSEPFESGIEQNEVFLRISYRQDSARKACACTDIDYSLRRDVFRQIRYSQ